MSDLLSTTDYEQINYGTYGRVLSMRIRDGQTFSFGYDNLGRMTSRNAPGSDPNVSFTHDNLGRVLTMSQSGHTLTYVYNALGQLTQATGPKGSVTYEYNDEGLRSRMDYPGAGDFYVTYDYNAAGDLEYIREKGAGSGTGVLAHFDYDDWGRRTTLTRGNSVVTTYGFDAAGRLDSLTNNLSGTANDQTLTFDFNTANQIVQRTSTNSTYDYSIYAAFTDSYLPNGLNQYSSVDGASQSYDDRGNLTSDGTNSYTYDYSNRLKTAPGSVSFAYDPGGRLYQEAVGSTSKQFLYDGIDLIAEYNGMTVTKRYVHGPGIDEPLVEYSGTGTSNRTFLIADERGSIVAGTNSSGAKTYINTYDEFGVPGSGNQGLFQYTGQIYLDSIDLYHYKARTYDPKTGRFLQADPIGYLAGMNMYGYVSNDPMNLVDPLGLDGCDAACKQRKRDRVENYLDWMMNYERPGIWGGSYLGNGATAQPDGRDGGGPTDNDIHLSDDGKSFVIGNPDTGTYETVPINMGVPPLAGTGRLISAALQRAKMLVGGVWSGSRPLTAADFGGKATATVFKTAHYRSRLRAAGVDVAKAEAFVAKEVAAIRPYIAASADVTGRFRLNNVLLEYRLQLRPNGTVSVGSIFPVK